MTSFSWWQPPVEHFQRRSEQLRASLLLLVSAHPPTMTVGGRDTQRTQNTLFIRVTTDHVQSILLQFIQNSKKCISVVQRRRSKTHLAHRTQSYPLRVGTSRYGPPSGIYNTHAPLCVVCMLFLEGYEANMSITSKRRCVVVLMSCDTSTNHDHRSERFQKSLVMDCIASMEW